MSGVEQSQGWIRLRGVRHNNLKNFDLDLPLGKLIVVTGLSGSGKSSLAFDTLYAEGQRRYIETFSPYARQFFDRMDKPRVDGIQGIPPAIALEQRNSVKTTRSTVGTMTEITDYMKLLWPHIAKLHCRGCGRAVRKDPPRAIWEEMAERAAGQEVVITFKLPLSEKLGLEESLGLLARQGYQRLLVESGGAGPKIVRVEEFAAELGGRKAEALTVVQDRVRIEERNRARFVEACEQGYHFGKGSLCIRRLPGWEGERFSNRLHCAGCDIEYREPGAALFSFNNPVGACAACKGFGRVIAIDYNLAMPDRRLSIAGGLVKPWQTGTGLESQGDLLKFCKKRKVPVEVPFEELSREHQEWVIEGDPGYGKDKAHEWPRAWYGVKGYFRWLESKAYKMHVRVQLARYRCYTTCPECQGRRFKEEALLYRAGEGLTLADFYQLPVREALGFIEGLPRPRTKRTDPFQTALDEVGSRLGYLSEAGLGYLTLDRPTRSLSGGETERVNLTTCLGSRLVNTLFVLDEPSVGLHARDTDRLVAILKRLRDAGNTVVVVEHEPSVMRAADEIVDLGPGQGERGGQVVFQGSYSKLARSPSSLTGSYLSGRKRVERPRRAEGAAGKGPVLNVSRATLHNVKELEVEIPLEGLVCISGVSGSGKSTLIRELVYPALVAKLGGARRLEEGEEVEEESCEGSCRLEGWEQVRAVMMVDQSSIGRTPRSNPAVYIGAFEHLREVFAESETARQQGLNSSAFSFNSGQGQCERCRGAGFEKIEMQFLSDIYIRCADCGGRRYRPHILEVKVASEGAGGRVSWSIADLLEATVDEALVFLGGLGSKAAGKAIGKLALLREVGLGYLRLGQPINTLSGGESQRLKLVSHLAEFGGRREEAGRALFIFDEPTTGLHFHDVQVLLQALDRLVEAGHAVWVIEHNLEVLRNADWIIDLGPGAGAEGGRIVAEGTPEEIGRNRGSVTGEFLRG